MLSEPSAIIDDIETDSSALPITLEVNAVRPPAHMLLSLSLLKKDEFVLSTDNANSRAFSVSSVKVIVGG